MTLLQGWRDLRSRRRHARAEKARRKLGLAFRLVVDSDLSSGRITGEEAARRGAEHSALLAAMTDDEALGYYI